MHAYAPRGKPLVIAAHLSVDRDDLVGDVHAYAEAC